ncbi:MAG: DUF4097 family beta strand repeat protein [Clostridia bacterium]|nr:DUF4097 family beta strand repeat protein [Clostridia bacterium]
MKKTAIALLIAFICVVLGAAICVGGLANLGFDFSRLDTTKYVSTEYAFEGTVDEIDLTLYTTDAQIVPARDGVCRVAVLEEEDYPHTVTLEGGQLSIQGSERRRPWSFGIRMQYALVTVYLPEESYHRLEAQTASGDLLVDGNFSFETAELEAATGDVTWRHAGTEDLEIAIATGDVVVADCAPGALQIAAATGDVSISEVITPGDMRCHVSTGDILLNRVDGKNIYLEGTTGDISGSILTPKAFHGEATTGSVSVPSTEAEGVCRVKTTTGDIKLWLSEE